MTKLIVTFAILRTRLKKWRRAGRTRCTRKMPKSYSTQDRKKSQLLPLPETELFKSVQLVTLPTELHRLLNTLGPFAYRGPSTLVRKPTRRRRLYQATQQSGRLVATSVRIFSWHLTDSVSGYNCLCDVSRSDDVTLCSRFTTAGSDQPNHPFVQRIQ